MVKIFLCTIVILMTNLIPFHSAQLLDKLESRYSTEVSVVLEHLVRRFPSCEFICVEDNSNGSITRGDLSFEGLYDNFAGAQQVRMGTNITYPRHEDIHRFAKEHCSFGVFIFQSFDELKEDWLVETIIPRYGPLMRKDHDHFLMLSPSAQVSNDILSSPRFGSKIKYKLAVHHSGSQIIFKNVDLYGGNNGLPRLQILKTFDIIATRNLETSASDLFPDMTKQFNGKVFRFAIPKVAFRFEIEKRSDGKYHPKRGFYKWWLDDAMLKFNFTYEMFYASFGGGTGKRLKNGTWVGATGDLFYGKADCSFIVGEIYSRHKFLGWSSALSYEWVIFMTHPPRNAYSAKAIFKPFTPLMWTLFFASIALVSFSIKQIADAGFDPKSRETGGWGYFRIMSYVVFVFLEQDREGPFKSSSVRTLCAFWLLFAMVTATAYRGKLVSLIAFPINTWVPQTFEELANSNFKVALNVVGKAGAAYVLIASSTSPVFQTITSKMELIPEAENCLQRAMDEDLGCIVWEGIADYAMVKNLTDKNGHVPLQKSTQIALFIGDGLVYERRAIFGEHLDRTIQASMQMGLTIKWFQLDQEFIIRERRIWERSQNISRKVYDFDDGPKKLVVSQFVGLFILSIVGFLVGCAVFLGEMYYHKRGSHANADDAIKAIAIVTTKSTRSSKDESSFDLPNSETSEVRRDLYEIKFAQIAKLGTYFHYNHNYPNSNLS